MKHIVMYIIIGFIIVAALTHPAGSTALLTTSDAGITGIGGLLTGANAQGGVKGTVGTATFA